MDEMMSYEEAIEQLRDAKFMLYGHTSAEGISYDLSGTENYFKCVVCSTTDYESFIDDSFYFVARKIHEYNWIGTNQCYLFYDDDLKKSIVALIEWENNHCSIKLCLVMGKPEMVSFDPQSETCRLIDPFS